MKGVKMRLAIGFRGRVASGLALAWFIALGSAQAANTVVNKNSSITIDFTSSAGLGDWVVDGVDQANQQWFWYRTAPGPQLDVSTISAPVISTFANTIQATYSNASIGVTLSYQLAGQNAGTRRSGLNEGVTIFNYTGAPLSLHFFTYTDFVLGGPAQTGNQYVQLQKNNGSATSTSVQYVGSPALGSNTVAITGSDILAQHPADESEAAFVPQTLNGLTTVNNYTLNNTSTAGPGHATWAFEWDFNIAAGSSAQISLTDNLQVPEPSTAAMLLLGLALWKLRRQCRTA